MIKFRLIKIMILPFLLTATCLFYNRFPVLNIPDLSVNEIEILNEGGPAPKILLLGDSRFYNAPLKKYFNSYTINYSAAGSTLTGIENRLPRLHKYSFDIVIIEIGFNDINQFTDFNFIERYRKVVARLNPHKIVICGIINPAEEFFKRHPLFGRQKLRRYNAMLKKMAAETGCIYVEAIDYTREHYCDDIHLNEAGNKLFLDSVLKAIHEKINTL